jgi:hypothetical protein
MVQMLLLLLLATVQYVWGLEGFCWVRSLVTVTAASALSSPGVAQDSNMLQALHAPTFVLIC